MNDCPRCNGQGHLGIRIAVDDYKTCPECGGTGDAPEIAEAVQEWTKKVEATGYDTTPKFFWSSYTQDELNMLDIAYGNEEQPFDLLDF